MSRVVCPASRSLPGSRADAMRPAPPSQGSSSALPGEDRILRSFRSVCRARRAPVPTEQARLRCCGHHTLIRNSSGALARARAAELRASGSSHQSLLGASTKSTWRTCQQAAFILKECLTGSMVNGIVPVAGFETETYRRLTWYASLEMCVSRCAQGFQLTGLLASLLAGAVGGIPFMGSEDRRTYERYHLRRNAPQRTD